jgi:hypothetical protein
MSMQLAAAALATSLASAPAEPPVIAETWAAPPIDTPMIRRAVREAIAEEKEIARAASKAAAIPYRITISSQPEIHKYERFAQQFDAAKVPGCLGAQGLQRQPTFIFQGLLALPFIPIAYLRGKCN